MELEPVEINVLVTTLFKAELFNNDKSLKATGKILYGLKHSSVTINTSNRTSSLDILQLCTTVQLLFIIYFYTYIYSRALNLNILYLNSQAVERNTNTTAIHSYVSSNWN